MVIRSKFKKFLMVALAVVLFDSQVFAQNTFKVGLSTGGGGHPTASILKGDEVVGWITSEEMAKILNIPNKGQFTWSGLSQDQYKKLSEYITENNLDSPNTAIANAKTTSTTAAVQPNCSYLKADDQSANDTVFIGGAILSDKTGLPTKSCGKTWPAACFAMISCKKAGKANGVSLDADSPKLVVCDQLNFTCPTDPDQCVFASNRPKPLVASFKGEIVNDSDFGSWIDAKIIKGDEVSMCVGFMKKKGSLTIDPVTTPAKNGNKCSLKDAMADTCTNPISGRVKDFKYDTSYLTDTGGSGDNVNPNSSQKAH